MTCAARVGLKFPKRAEVICIMNKVGHKDPMRRLV